jgi:glutamate N-acetyltransferase/amino-acid N-acetyltransferase
MAVGIAYQNRTDVMLADIAPGSVIAGVFTQSATRSAAVCDCQDKLAAFKPGNGMAIVVNSGNANTFTGQRGQNDVGAIAQKAAQVLGLPVGHVFTASTGVIGAPLPADKITNALPGLAAHLDAKGAKQAAHAIMTTDTFAKGATTRVDIGGTPITITGFAKGSGMIAPNMATMLGFVFTDAAISPQMLQTCLAEVNNRSFNCITVDGDTSTSDTVLLAATGRAGNAMIDTPAAAQDFTTALGHVMHDLALQIVKDGEGATKLVEIRISGANSEQDAKRVARSIAQSPLVKTAIAGEDPNWGRIVMAVGKSGAIADRDRLTIKFGDILVAENGWVAETYQESDAAAYMTQSHLLIDVDLGLGPGAATMWTCDLTHAYIDINADYRS